MTCSRLLQLGKAINWFWPMESELRWCVPLQSEAPTGLHNPLVFLFPDVWLGGPCVSDGIAIDWWNLLWSGTLPTWMRVDIHGDTWVAQSVRCPTLAQVMISQFIGLSPALGSVLTAQILEPASDYVFPPLSAPPSLMLCLSLKSKQTLQKKKVRGNFRNNRAELLISNSIHLKGIFHKHTMWNTRPQRERLWVIG